MQQAKKKKPWLRFRHRVVRNILYVLLYPYIWLRYGIRIEPFREQGDRPYLILLNHQTPFDQFFAGIAFRGPVYYLATEDIFSLGWISSVIRFLLAPIPIKKQTTDVQAVMTCLRLAREGGTICIAPEGNRTYSGRTEYMNPAIAPLVRKMKLPVALFRIEGGYGTEPRWSDVVRRGPMRAFVSRVIEPEEYARMTDEALYQQIQEGLYVDESRLDGAYPHKKSAEYMERCVYVCPRCGLSEFYSRGQIIRCTKCGLSARYLPTKEFDGEDFPFRFMADWYDYQESFINDLDVTALMDTPLYRDTARLSKVILCSHKELLRKEAQVALYGDRVVIDEGNDPIVLPFREVSVATVLGRNKLNIYHNKTVYQFKGSKRFNALKYVHICYRYKNIIKGDIHGKFLGI